MARPTARRPQPRATAASRRGGSVSDSDRDPALRRKVGDLTKKLEAMTTKYETLKEVAASTRESNFDTLKKRTEQTAKEQDTMIKALKQQLADLQSRTSDLTSLRKQISRLEKENGALTTENKTLQASLATSQNENKTLTSKLAAARSSAPPETKNVPGSAVKQARSAVVLPGAAEAKQAASIAQSKVDLYSDLTDLVICGVKKSEEGDDVFDCIQTGRNGSLHFTLSVPPTGAHDDAEICYNPRLNADRDRDLLELLPDYLCEEISFPRSHVPKFYLKVADSMSKKIVFEDE